MAFDAVLDAANRKKPYWPPWATVLRSVLASIQVQVNKVWEICELLIWCAHLAQRFYTGNASTHNSCRTTKNPPQPSFPENCLERVPPSCKIWRVGPHRIRPSQHSQ